ncbi:hypothetical protein WJX72_001248 [[Myrmecia] bisecta]|uniref:Uncharacterized protein n=1 Tax=[Myrmecia] bisecta TaxID=41462 RepID=A0AAW1Q851_9CHLO
MQPLGSCQVHRRQDTPPMAAPQTDEAGISNQVPNHSQQASPVDLEEDELRKREQDRQDREATQARYRARLKAEAAQAARQAKLWAAAQQKQAGAAEGASGQPWSPAGPTAEPRPEAATGSLIERLTRDWDPQAIPKGLRPIHTSPKRYESPAHGIFDEPPLIRLPELDASPIQPHKSSLELLPTPDQATERARHADWLRSLRGSPEDHTPLSSSPSLAEGMQHSQLDRPGPVSSSPAASTAARSPQPSVGLLSDWSPDEAGSAGQPVAASPKPVEWAFGRDLSQVGPPKAAQGRPDQPHDVASGPQRAAQSLELPSQAQAQAEELRRVNELRSLTAPFEDEPAAEGAGALAGAPGSPRPSTSTPQRDGRPGLVSRAKAFFIRSHSFRKTPASESAAGAPELGHTRSCDIDLLY